MLLVDLDENIFISNSATCLWCNIKVLAKKCEYSRRSGRMNDGSDAVHEISRKNGERHILRYGRHINTSDF
jgi:hypothetical protein